jgi:maltose alpha-D-glucosyltransferase/alpha-amylase
LASAPGPDFAPEPFAADETQGLVGALRGQAAQVFDLLKDKVASLPDELVDQAGLVLGWRRHILDRFRFPGEAPLGQRIRIHGDYHLGQVLQVKTDFVILDFEGDTSRPLAERRAKASPLKDIASMMRSLSYAAYAGLIAYAARHPEDWERLEPWARLWERSTEAEFLRAYRETARGASFLPSSEDGFRRLLRLFLINKALLELAYELDHRPSWVRIPLIGILDLSLGPGSGRT